jgi:Ala-tRNA(Pro) deacylase
MVIANGQLAMLVLPAPMWVQLPEVGRILGDPAVRLAREEEFASVFPDCEVGAMPPFGNLYDVQVYVDIRLAEEKMIYFQAGTHTHTMSMRFAGYEWLVRPIIAAFSLEEAVQPMD